MSEKRGIKIFKDSAVAAIFSEFNHLDQGAIPRTTVVISIHLTDITAVDKQYILEVVNLIKEKSSGKIKGRTCANNSKQISYLKYGENYSSPTISIEALFRKINIDYN